MSAQDAAGETTADARPTRLKSVGLCESRDVLRRVLVLFTRGHQGHTHWLATALLGFAPCKTPSQRLTRA
jgi:hypothetical protein